jgi:alkaline phosphatase D
MRLDRRSFLKAGFGGAALLGVGVSGCASHPGAAAVEPGTNPFRHGVASGDPLADRVILWTRVSPERGRLGEPVEVDWWIARDARGRDRIAEGRLDALPEHDFTLKVDATGLEPGRDYHYGFATRAGESPIGRTRTLPDERVERLRLAFVSCSNYPHGFFNAYADLAERDDVDVVIHLGDYFYEYANEAYGDGSAIGRISDPTHEVVSLEDYRRRHACYKADPDLQAAHASHPWITVWDDHESANNAWKDGAKNHHPERGEGEWSERRLVAIRAYYEWMPIRDLPTELFRTFRIGRLAEIIMLDTRLAGRDEQVSGTDDEGAEDPTRTLLGEEQEGWLFDALTRSQEDGIVWRVVGQQIVLSPLGSASGEFNPDSWDGYRESRRRLLGHIEASSIEDVIFLTGDVHSTWGIDVPPPTGSDETYDPKSGAGARAVELVAPAVSSRPLGWNPAAVEFFEDAADRYPYVRYMNLENNGYGILDLDFERARVQWFFVETVERRSRQGHCSPVFESRLGTNHLVQVEGASCDP